MRWSRVWRNCGHHTRTRTDGARQRTGAQDERATSHVDGEPCPRLSVMGALDPPHLKRARPRRPLHVHMDWLRHPSHTTSPHQGRGIQHASPSVSDVHSGPGPCTPNVRTIAAPFRRGQAAHEPWRAQEWSKASIFAGPAESTRKREFSHLLRLDFYLDIRCLILVGGCDLRVLTGDELEEGLGHVLCVNEDIPSSDKASGEGGSDWCVGGGGGGRE